MSRGRIIALGAGVLTVATVTVVAVLALTQSAVPEIAGLYSAQNGREIRLTRNGALTEATLPSIGAFMRSPLRYRIRGNDIFVWPANTEFTSSVPVTFKIRGNGLLVGWGTIWRKYKVEPCRPSALVGTYTSVSGDGQTLTLDRNGAVYCTQPLPTGETVGSGTWVAGKDGVTVTYPYVRSKTVYSVQGGNLIGGGKQLARTSNRAIVPVTK